MTPRPAVVLLCALGALAAAAAALAGCDESQVWHTPDPTLERMQLQPRADPFWPAMRTPPPGTVPRGHANVPPPPVTRALVERGKGAFETACAPCHGVLGDGDSVVATKMLLRKPPSLMEDRIRALTRDQLYEVVTHGYGLMPPYAGQLSFQERWAVVSYVQALELSQSAQVDRLPPELRAELAKEAP